MGSQAIEWPGVVVVGAGAAGILTAHLCEEYGLPALLIAGTAPGGGQSSHCHGYLHQGYIYRELRRESALLLREANAWWTDALGEESESFTASSSTIVFLSSEHHDEAVRLWQRLGMTFQAIDCRDVFPHAYRAYVVPERSVAPVLALKASLRSPAEVPVIRGQAIRLHTRGRAVRSIGVDISGERQELIARHYVLAAGLGITQLLPEAGRHVQMRISFMLVCRSAQRLPHAFCLPGIEAQGLFASSRPFGGERVYLISNCVSFWPGPELQVARSQWLRGMARTLAEQVPSLWGDPGTKWGVYTAPKVDVAEPARSGMPEGGLLPLSYRNLTAIVSGKYVLAPQQARRAVASLPRGLGHTWPGAACITSLAHPLPSVEWAAEDWTKTPMTNKQALFSAVDSGVADGLSRTSSQMGAL